MVLTATGYVPIEAGASGSADPSSGVRPTRNQSISKAPSAYQKAAADDPKHPGWPAGTPDGRGGQFRPKDAEAAPDSGVTHASLANDPRVISDAIPDNIWKPGAQYAQSVVQNNAKTNNPIIDSTTDVLLQTLVRVHALAGDGSGPWYGTRIHILFANDLRSQNLPGIGRSGVEQSFSLGDIAKYGEDGTVRVDVYMRDDTGKILAVWDVKTGGAVLTGARVRQLRAELGVGNDVPIIELHVIRGATLKARGLGCVGLIIIAMVR